MNIAGGDFGCAIDGTCTTSSTQLPLSTLGGGDGAGQMQHFVTDDQMNIFRIPVSWQFLTNNVLGATLDSTNLGKYDQVMQACLNTGAYCAIDIHNFGRWNGEIIGQSSTVTDDMFVSLWTQLATKYASQSKVLFGIMNEPHDLDIATWAATCQKVVTAIRNAGASTQMILLPGNNFASAGTFVSNGSGAALIAITNPDGTTTNLILDVHKYLDVDNSGTHAECTTDNIADAFALVADFLRTNSRQALVSETGAGSSASCFTDFCAQNAYLNSNSDVFLGYIAWAAGSFATSYVLSLTPTKTNGQYVDNALASQCVIAPWLNSTNTASSAAGAVATASPTTTRTSIMTRTTTASVFTGTSSVQSIITNSNRTATIGIAAATGAIASTTNGTVKASATATSTSSFTGEAHRISTGSSLVVVGLLAGLLM
ncbi:hypothetical protein BP5796_04499 [Coleophoma crateriformis]|uniref:Endoglucanase EG-II n=1 Tax=Coleophoma crateriformis TaxID=565419 RepID=A0A3D8SB53_9HELO|nr:hypothetical protein BP5796_04499 [Coleophoma crateriformis]